LQFIRSGIARGDLAAAGARENPHRRELSGCNLRADDRSIMIDDLESSQRRIAAPVTSELGGAARYRFGGASLVVDPGDLDTGRWLREFLTPWFAAEPPVAPSPAVRLLTNARRHAELRARQTEVVTRPVPCFVLDSALVSYPGWTEPDGTSVVADTEYDCFYCVRGADVEVIARPQERVARVGLLRVVREIVALRALAAPGMLDLHAAAFVHRGRAILLMGGKRAGKATLLAHVLASGQSDLLANDRLMIERDTADVLGVPTVVPVREETERRFPALGSGLPRRATLFHAGELGLPDAVTPTPGARLVLSPGQFAHQLGAGAAGRAPLGAIVFPEIAPEEKVWSLLPMGREECALRLCEGLYAGRAEPRATTIFQTLAGESANVQAQLALARQIASTATVVRCRLGPDAYRGHARAWLRALPLPKTDTPA
jgi:hypothetical protein